MGGYENQRDMEANKNKSTATNPSSRNHQPKFYNDLNSLTSRAFCSWVPGKSFVCRLSVGHDGPKLFRFLFPCVYLS